MVVSQLAPETTRDELAEYFAAHHAKASRQTQRERQQADAKRARVRSATLQDTWRVVLASEHASEIPTCPPGGSAAGRHGIPTYLKGGFPIDTYPPADRNPGKQHERKHIAARKT